MDAASLVRAEQNGHLTVSFPGDGRGDLPEHPVGAAVEGSTSEKTRRTVHSLDVTAKMERRLDFTAVSDR